MLLSIICTKCKEEIPENEQLESQAEKYPLCTKCWNEWKEMKIMVINEMHLDYLYQIIVKYSENMKKYLQVL